MPPGGRTLLISVIFAEMENFIVSARKYRPSTFKSVVGQEVITSTLQNSIRNNQLAQAFLFCGPRGVGKTTCARILAKTINCTNLGQDIEPCNACESCTSFNQNASFNIHELDAASNNSVDDIRNLVDQVRFAPQAGKYKIFIIDEVHMLSTAAFNAFLKTLEEPPAHALFILATTERNKILPTILSRCQVFTFNRIQVDDIARHLEYVAKSENINADPDAVHIIAQKADGGLRDALSMFDQIVSFSGGTSLTYEAAVSNLNVLDYDYFFRMTDHLYAKDYRSALMLLEEVMAKGFDLANFLAGQAEHFRNLLVCQDAVTLPLLQASANVRSRYQTQSQQWTPILLMKAIEIAVKAETGLRQARNQRLHVELCLLQLVQLHMPVAAAAAPQSTAPQSTAPGQAAPSPQPQRPVINFRGVNPVKAVSINQFMNRVEPEAVKKEEPDHSVIEDLPEEPFKTEDLLNAWKSYAEELRSNGRVAMAGTLTLSEPALKDRAVSFYVANESSMRELELEKAALLTYLRKTLRNYSVSLEIVKTDAPLKTRPFSPEEKLKALEDKNPDIALLRQKLGLKPE